MIKTYTKSQINAKNTILRGKNILLTGRPGTGKTELLRDICETYEMKGKKVIKTSTTGIAATNFDGGRTIHSVLKWSPRKKDYDYARCSEALKDASLLILDEVSMMPGLIINHLKNCLLARNDRPQIIFSGDFFQFPPVCDKYYPFENPNWSFFDLEPCVLNEVVRQRNVEYINALEKVMFSDPSCLSYINEAYYNNYFEDAICLCTVNDLADMINYWNFTNLSGTAVSYEANGNIAEANFRTCRVLEKLDVKVNMRVIALRNDALGRYQNGSLGTVVDMDRDKIWVRFDNGRLVDVTRVEFILDNIDTDKDEIAIVQFPLAGGNAISIHKSQGQTFSAVNIWAPVCWASGQLYVALSRARDIKGVHLMAPITADSLKTDPRVIEYYKKLLG